MSRAERLLDLLQHLRRQRGPVSGSTLAEELGISLRTLYRDIASLQAQGARIEGEPGFGYVLRPGFTLPPLMFSEEELEALVLGSRWVAHRADGRLGRAASDALAKIAAVLPTDLREELESTTLLVGPGDPIIAGDIDLGALRRAIREERKVVISYRDKTDTASTRTLWPFAVGFFDRVRVIVAWCELRDGFRHFRVDRISALETTDTRYPRSRRELLRTWFESERIPPQ
ncbi:transcriptional regulator [Corallococcus sp. H22C18031201]|uniref:helix-turn-helix transcriptional regulator n=1 Tax=Citreicoccus inhibens TaxID=2849499 RepID=UPI000E71143B|nr:YafY family protein [Citreicoccus inhibens]MBU8895142.1 YafY family transcriptional regulator [Citreicoccus inhibens]RJS27576.1 transcriptional regulator [Corallococcus sp. H22C18031201]